MGTVYLARDRVRDVSLALKTVARVEPARVAHLKREFRAVSQLRHPNLVELYDLYAETGACFTMEWVEGVDPRSWVRHAVDRSPVVYDATLATPTTQVTLGGDVRVSRPLPGAPPLDPERLRRTIAELAAGLAFLHAHGVVHRDVKASNALVRGDGSVKLLDFGLAFDWRGADDTRSSGPLVGTVAYMAPEYLHGHRVSPAMDLYALGVLGFELVTGAVPFDGSFYEIVASHVEQRAPRAIAFNPACPEDLDELIAMLLAKDPAARPSAEEVVAAALGAASPARRVARARPCFVGRSRELAMLREPGLTVITGPSGVGKTALCDEAASLFEGRVWRARCDERERVAYRALDPIVETIAAELDAAGACIEGLPHAGALARVFPSLSGAIAPSVRDLMPVADLRVERERAFEGLAALFARRLAGRPGLVVIDELEHADAASLEAIAVIARARVVSIVATCTGEPPPLGGRVIALAPLGDDEIATLVRSVAPSTADDDVRETVRAAAGNPYLAELIAHEGAAAGAEARRLASLGLDEQIVAGAAAVAGGPVTFAALRAATELPGSALQSALRGLELARVLRNSGESYDYTHQRLRRAGYERAPARALHARFAAWHEQAGDRAETIAHHWAEAGEAARAAPFALAAADAAFDKLAFDHAARWYRRAIELGASSAHARAREAEALLWSGWFALAATRCRELAGAATGPARDRWLLRAAEAQIKLGDLGPGLALIERVIGERIAPRPLRGLFAWIRPRRSDDIIADAYRVIASFVSTPRPVEAFEFVLRSIALARRRGDHAGEGMGFAMVAAYLAAGTLGRLGDAPLAAAGRTQDPYARMVAAGAAGILATSRGHWDEMRAAHARGEAICNELGLERSWEASFLRSYRALGELYAGELAPALELANSLTAGDLFTRAMVGSFRGRALAACGRTSEAAVALTELARDPAASRGMPRMYRYALEGELALADRRWRDALALTKAMGKAARAEWLSILPAVAVMRDLIAATASLGAGDLAKARTLARRIRRLGARSFYLPTALRLEAQATGDRALLDRAALAAAQRGGRVERAAIAFLRDRSAPPEDLRASVDVAIAGRDT